MRATRCFPNVGDGFVDYDESKSWTPAGFRDWPEVENKAPRFSEWSGHGVIPGMLQTERYARALLATLAGVTEEGIRVRLANRMERQKRVLFRDDPPTANYVIDHAALYRLVGSPTVMAEQCAHLGNVGALPNVTIQVLPAMAHPATQGGFIVTDDAAYAETVVGGYVYSQEETVTSLERLFGTLRAECYRASESAAIIRKAETIWTGEHQATQGPTAATA